MSVTRIRPWQVLGISDDFHDEIRFFMPQAQGSGSLLSIESLLLIKLMRVVRPEKIFEFGTYKGLTTRLLLANLPQSDAQTEARIFTLDLPNLDEVRFQGTDVDLAREVLDYRRRYLEEKNSHLVHQILQDSMKFDPSPFVGNFSMIFIDANHALDYVKKDTENSFQMLAPGMSCVVWHDYGHPEFPELTAYVDELATKMKIFLVGGTKMAFHPRGFDPVTSL
jgi:hypothetical protein